MMMMMMMGQRSEARRDRESQKVVQYTAAHIQEAVKHMHLHLGMAGVAVAERAGLVWENPGKRHQALEGNQLQVQGSR
jgi:hypothetical protein